MPACSPARLVRAVSDAYDLDAAVLFSAPPIAFVDKVDPHDVFAPARDVDVVLVGPGLAKFSLDVHGTLVIGRRMCDRCHETREWRGYEWATAPASRDELIEYVRHCQVCGRHLSGWTHLDSIVRRWFHLDGALPWRVTEDGAL